MRRVEDYRLLGATTTREPAPVVERRAELGDLVAEMRLLKWRRSRILLSDPTQRIPFRARRGRVPGEAPQTGRQKIPTIGTREYRGGGRFTIESC